MLQGTTTIPLIDALSTQSRLESKLSEVLLPQPYLPPNNCWVKGMIKAPMIHNLRLKNSGQFEDTQKGAKS